MTDNQDRAAEALAAVIFALISTGSNADLVARHVIAAGWASPEEVAAREQAARREAEAKVASLRAEVEALAEEWEKPVEGRKEYAPLAFQCAADEVRHALAEPKRDEEP
jgi:hypothetical protein